MSSSIRESFSSGNVVFGGLAGANSEGLANEEFGSPEAISPSRDGTKLLRTGLQPFSVSSARAIEGFDIRSRPWLEEVSLHRRISLCFGSLVAVAQ